MLDIFGTSALTASANANAQIVELVDSRLKKVDDPTDDGRTTVVGILSQMVGAGGDSMSRFRELRNHRAKYLAALAIYDDDPRVESGVDGVAEDATVPFGRGANPEWSFRLEPDPQLVGEPDSDAVKDQLSEQMSRLAELGFRDRIEEWTGTALLGGNEFWQVVADYDNARVARIVRMPSYDEGFYTRPVYDSSGSLLGYEQYDTSYISNSSISKFAPWQICHVKWNAKGRIWGRPLISSSANTVSMLHRSEVDMQVARRLRAYARMAWSFPDKTPDQIREVIQINEEMKQRQGPLNVGSDLYTNGKIELLDPANNALGQIEDIRYHERKMFDGIGRPEALYGGRGHDLNRDILEQQEDVYARRLARVNRMMNVLIRHTNDVDMKLQGKHPDEYPYRIVWAPKHQRTPSEDTDWVLKMFGSGLLDRDGARIEAGFDPDEIREREEANPDDASEGFDFPKSKKDKKEEE